MDYRKDVVLKNIPNVPESKYLVLGAMGLCGEAGETSEVIKKYIFQEMPLDRDKAIKELGDVRWYFELLCIALNTTIQEVEALNAEKLKIRFPSGFTAQDSINRKDEK